MKEMRAQDAIPSVQNIESRQTDRQTDEHCRGLGRVEETTLGRGEHCWKVRVSLGMTRASLDWFC